MIVHARLSFGTQGNAQACLISGWGATEMHSTWAVDEQCALRVPCPPSPTALALELDVSPNTQLPFAGRQRLAVRAGTTKLGETLLDRATTLCFDIPRVAHERADEIVVTLNMSDSNRFAEPRAAQPRARVELRGMRLIAAEPERPRWPRSLAPLRIPKPTQAAVEDTVRARTGLSATELLRGFESLGHNCEFGLMQRELDTETLGLLRFGGIEPGALLLGLECAFAGIDDPDGLDVETGRMDGREEYLMRHRRFGLRTHTGLFTDDVAPEAVDVLRMARHLDFLQRQFAGAMKDASRIFVLHHPAIHDAVRARPFLYRLRSHGDNCLLYVTEHPTVQPGTIVQERAHLCHGYIDKLVPMNEAMRINARAWLSLCANTHYLLKGGATQRESAHVPDDV